MIKETVRQDIASEKILFCEFLWVQVFMYKKLGLLLGNLKLPGRDQS